MAEKDVQYLERDPDTSGVRHFAQTLGFERMETTEGHSIIEVKVMEELCNLHRTVHGGVVMSLVDAAGYWAGATHNGSTNVAATVSLNCDFLRGARLEKTTKLRAEGQLRRRGKSIFFSSISVYAYPGGDLIATGQGVYSLTPKH